MKKILLSLAFIASFLLSGVASAATTYQLKDVQVVLGVANISIDYTSDTADTVYIQLGRPAPAGTGKNCIPETNPPSPISPALFVLPTTLYPNAGHLGHTFSGLSGTYCISVVKGAPAPLTSYTPIVENIGTFSADSTSFGNNNTQTTNLSKCESTDNTSYCLLAPLPGIGENGKVNTTTGIQGYLNGIIRLVIGLIGVLAVVMVVVGGIEYMSTVSVGEKEGAKSRITNALFGLILALSAYTILNTINPNLVNLSIYVPNVTVTLDGDEGIEDSATTPTGVTKQPSTVSNGGSAALATQILANSNITLNSFNVVADSSNDERSSPLQNIKDAANGIGSYTSIRGHAQGKQTVLHSAMLAGILEVAKAVGKVQVNEIAGGRHAATSSHYTGRSVDFQASSSDTARAKKIMDACYSQGANIKQIFGPCNNDTSSEICKATGYKTNKEHQTHVHCGW